MTWDQRQAAVFSAGIRSHRSASDGPVLARISPRQSVASSSWFAKGTSARARNVVRHWLTVALIGVEAKRDLTLGLTDKERLGFDMDSSDLNFWLDEMGPFEAPTLLLTEDMRASGF